MFRSPLVRHISLLCAVSGLVFFFNLGTARLWDRDEPRNAGCAAEMLSRNDWVVPVFNGQLRSQKPALLYWLIMSTYGVFGVNEWAARLPSALMGMGTVLLTYAMGRRLFSPTAAFWGAVALATSLFFDVAARAATPDATLIFFCTLAIALFVLGVFPNQAASEAPPSSDGAANIRSPFSRVLKWQVALTLYAALGLAVLTKGPVGLVLPVAVLGMFLLLVRRVEPARGTWIGAILRVISPANFVGACLQLRPITALLVVALVALPWYAWVGLRTNGAWLEGFLWHDNVRRALETLEDHRGSILFYPAAILAGCFPWSVFALPVILETVASLRRADSHKPAILICVSWIGVYVGLFSLAQTKLPSYVTPCYPAIALLIGMLIERWMRGELRIAGWWPHVSLLALSSVSCACLAALMLAAHYFLPGEEWLGAVALFPLAGGIAALWFTWKGSPQKAVLAVAASAVALHMAFFGGALVRLDQRQQCQMLFREIARRGDQPVIAAYGCLESSWVYYSGQPIREFQLGGAAVPVVLPDGTREPGARPARSIAEFALQREAFIITTGEHWPALRPLLPPEMQVLAEAPYFLEQEKLLLVGWNVTPERPLYAPREAPVLAGR
jgi:4-amino-4-deoxy-L-arabinose transferase-like glycosyltransferase